MDILAPQAEVETPSHFIPLFWDRAVPLWLYGFYVWQKCKVAILTHVYLWWGSQIVRGRKPGSQHFSFVPQTPALCWYLKQNNLNLWNSQFNYAGANCMMEMKSCKVFVVCMLVTCYINIYFFTVSPYNIALVKKKRKREEDQTCWYCWLFSLIYSYQVKKRFKETNNLKQKVNNHLPPPRCQRYHVSSVLLLVTTYPWWHR